MTRAGCVVVAGASLGCRRPNLFDCTQHGIESSRMVFRCSHGECHAAKVIVGLDGGPQQASFGGNASRQTFCYKCRNQDVSLVRRIARQSLPIISLYT